MNRLFNAAFYTGIASLPLTIAFILLVLMMRPDPDTQDSPWVRLIAQVEPVLLLLSLCSVLLLYIEGWLLVVAEWSKRRVWVNILYIVLLVIIPFISGFATHFIEMWRTDSGSTKSNGQSEPQPNSNA